MLVLGVVVLANAILLHPSVEEQWDGKNCSVKGLAYGEVHRQFPKAKPEFMGYGKDTGCYVSDKYRFIFIHTLKNAGSSTQEFLREALCDGGAIETCDQSVLRVTQCSKTYDKHPDYFRWTWARDPLDRAVSLYAMAIFWQKTMPVGGHGHGKGLLRGQGVDTVEAMRGVSFARYWGNPGREQLSKMDPIHFKQQAAFMRSKDGCFAVDYVGRLSDGDSDMGRIVERIGAKLLKDFYAQNGFKAPHTWNMGTKMLADGALDLHKELEDKKTLKALHELYATDCELFGCEK